MYLNRITINSLYNMYSGGHLLANWAICGQLYPAFARDTPPGTPDNSENDIPLSCDVDAGYFHLGRRP
jgi:hypothetical protein